MDQKMLDLLEKEVKKREAEPTQKSYQIVTDSNGNVLRAGYTNFKKSLKKGESILYFDKKPLGRNHKIKSKKFNSKTKQFQKKTV